MDVKTRYVAGFMFNMARTKVALIRKSKPEWQRGKLNGPGGKIEKDETAAVAMAREFREETGYKTEDWRWSHFLQMTGTEGGGWSVDFFVMAGDLDILQSPEEEKIEIISLSEITPLREDMVENLPWLIPLALDHFHDTRPLFVQTTYSK